jgi:3-keto-disaccharide hydrolase
MKRILGCAVALAAALVVFGCASEGGGGGGGWVTLLDGTGMKGWYPVGDGNWHVEDGAVVADKLGGKKKPGFLVSDKSYKDFELHVEFWVSHDANSGIYMRCGNPVVFTDKICYEANIFDERKDPSYGTGAVTNFAKVDPMPKAGGKWNTYDITLQGDHIVLVLNGVKTADIHHSRLKDGQIALQYAKGVVKFRKVTIREL